MSSCWTGYSDDSDQNGPVDIGCGRGAVTRVLAHRAQRVVATEVSEEAVQAAAESLADMDNVEVRLLDLFAGPSDEHPFSDQRFNLVLLSEVLEHVEDDVGALRRIRQLLEDVGILSPNRAAGPRAVERGG